MASIYDRMSPLILDEAGKTSAALSSTGSNARSMREGMSERKALQHTPITSTATHAQLTVMDIRQDEVVSALDNGEIDLAIGHFVGVPNWARQQFLRSTSYVCAMRSDHPDIDETLSLAQFLNARHALYWTHESTYGRLDEMLAKRGYTRDIALRIPRLAAIPFAVATSDLLVTIPEDLGMLFQKFLPIKLLPMPLALPGIQIKQYWHERLHADPGHRWLRNVVRQVVNEVDLT